MAEDAAAEGDGLGFVGSGQVRDAADRRVHRCAAEVLPVDVLVSDRSHDIRSGHEHVARALDHDRHVCDRRGVDGPTGTRTHDQRDLRDDPRGQRVAQEDVGVSTERDDALLDARPAGVVEPDDRRADLHRQVHDLADLLGMRLRQRAPEDGEVLAEHEHQSPVDATVARHHAVTQIALAIETEVDRPVGDEGVHLDERARIQQQRQALPGRQLSAAVLLLDSRRASAEQRLLSELAQSLDLVPVGGQDSEPHSTPVVVVRGHPIAVRVPRGPESRPDPSTDGLVANCDYPQNR